MSHSDNTLIDQLHVMLVGNNGNEGGLFFYVNREVDEMRYIARDLSGLPMFSDAVQTMTLRDFLDSPYRPTNMPTDAGQFIAAELGEVSPDDSVIMVKLAEKDMLAHSIADMAESIAGLAGIYDTRAIRLHHHYGAPEPRSTREFKRQQPMSTEYTGGEQLITDEMFSRFLDSLADDSKTT